MVFAGDFIHVRYERGHRLGALHSVALKAACDKLGEIRSDIALFKLLSVNSSGTVATVEATPSAFDEF
tara:strand:+ start:1034 stop:1237 length:204 start_codon:yes stop_codon:yes gene_type:complete